MPNRQEVIQYIWETTADMAAEAILTQKLTGRPLAAFVLTIWPEMIHSILETTSVNYHYSKEKFCAMSYERQRLLAGEKFSCANFAKEVERRFKIYQYLFTRGQQQQARA